MFDVGLTKDGSLFKDALPLLVREAIGAEEPLRLDEVIDKCETSLFQKFILKKCEATMMLLQYPSE